MSPRTLAIVIIVILVGGLALLVGTMKRDVPAEKPAAGQEAPMGKRVAGDPMVGTWRSKDDAKFSREFKADGTVVDRYEGDASATQIGTYTAVDTAAEAVPGVPAANLAGAMVIKVLWQNDPQPMYFSISSITEVELSMINLSGRGNILSFERVM